jgi:hypothetical protein
MNFLQRRKTAHRISALTVEERAAVYEFSGELDSWLAGRPEVERREILALTIDLLRAEVPDAEFELILSEVEEQFNRARGDVATTT